MSRDIKFRVWDKEEKKFTSYPTLTELLYEDGHYYDASRLEHHEVTEFTGLKDKNGTEIYEGDIVRQGDSYNSEVKYNNHYGGFEPWCKQIEGCDSPKEYPCEVIGNIYENSELLNTGK